jgi:anti-sigma regulatory factor (Ser/Thr protein kinase)
MSSAALRLDPRGARCLIDHQVEPGPRAARELRGVIRDRLRVEAVISESVVADAVLMMHELMVNVVLHARARTMRVTVVLLDAVGVLMGVVQDDGVGGVVLPARPEPGDESGESGRGLALVVALADTCMVTPYREGKAVCWALGLTDVHP